MIPGSRINCVMGMVSIRDFGIATEVLQAHVMTFVNQVAEIVHGVVDEHHGAPNKNNGDTFMVIWRLDWQNDEDAIVQGRHDGKSALAERERQNQKTLHTAEMAAMSFVLILAGVSRSEVLAEYRGHPGLLQRIQQYRVDLGVGLHYGWAIEGAIGSEFKIDASYLSPNVHIASRLEALTRYF